MNYICLFCLFLWHYVVVNYQLVILLFTDIFWENMKRTVITINSFFMRIPKLVPEFWLSAFSFLTSREVRLGSLVTFDPNFDPLKMRNVKKEEYFLLLLFWEESESAIRFWFWQLWNFDPCGGSYFDPLTFGPLDLALPEHFLTKQTCSIEAHGQFLRMVQRRNDIYPIVRGLLGRTRSTMREA